MSYSYEIKKELHSKMPVANHCILAQLYGMLLCSRYFSGEKIALQTGNQYILDLYKYLLGKAFQITPSVSGENGKNYHASISTQAERSRILSFFGYHPKTQPRHINPFFIKEACCKAAFLRGAFSVCATVIDPQKEYHLEFVLYNEALCNDLFLLLYDLGFAPRQSNRGEAYLIYFKESEHIEDLLTYIGASHAALSLMNVKIYKDVRNLANRRTNCDTANLTKTADAAARQIEDIEYIFRHRGEDFLPEELHILAKIRLEHPEMSLKELGEALPSPLSRSGVNHRLGRISQLCKQLKEENGEGK